MSKILNMVVTENIVNSSFEGPEDAGPYDGFTTNEYSLQSVVVQLVDLGDDELIPDYDIEAGITQVGDTVYVVCENYDEGDTFGSIRGLTRAIKPFTTRVAAQVYLLNEANKTSGYFCTHNFFHVVECIVEEGKNHD